MNQTLTQWLEKDYIKKFGIASVKGNIITILEQNKDGLCLNEIGFLVSIERSTISPRLNELEKQGVVIRNEKRNSFISGNNNDVWKLAKDYNDKVELVE